jgi:phosphatidylserine decarboxylase
MRLAKEGLKFILPALGAALACFLAGWTLAGVLFLVPAAAFIFFFRDPERLPPEGERLIVSPADGRVMAVEEAASHPDLGGPARRVVIFLSLLDVHVVRSPVAGRTAAVRYNPGRFLPAYRPEAGEKNESSTIVLREGPTDLVLKLMVGVAARRIKRFIKEGDAVARGQRIGLMYFGSRAEVFVPPAAAVGVSPGMKVRAGESVIAEVAE